MSGGVAGKAVRDGNPEESFASRAVTPNPVEYPERLGNFDAPARYAHVLIDRRSRRVEQALTYAVPAELVPGIQIGSRVVVPLGRSTAPGYVIGLPAEADVPDVRPIRALIGGGPVFDAELLGVVRWVADRYLCSLPDALRGAMPAETLARPTRVVRPVVEGEALRAALLDLEKAGRPAVLAVMRALARLGRQPLPALRRVMEREAARAGSGAGVRAGGRDAARARGGDVARAGSGDAARAAAGDAARVVEALARQGLVAVEDAILPPRGRPRVQTWARLAVTADEAAAAARMLQARAPLQGRVLEALARRPGGMAATTDLEREVAGAVQVVRRLAARGLVAVEAREVRRDPLAGETFTPTQPLVPTPEQGAALAVIGESVRAARGEAFLLYGVTGSGKTEVYLQALAVCLEAGRSAVVLVPEISLTPQTVERFRARLGARLAVFHSRLSGGERFDEWRRIRAGQVDAVVGARSAVFAPLPRLGLIVVDEEHEPSYKQEQVPRYHAREVALARAGLTGVTVVLGSATPAVETFHGAQRGGLRLLRLSTRVEGRPLPQVSVVDMRQEHAAGRRGILSERLQAALADHLARRSQVILFLNRRGYAGGLLCRECGEVIRCRRCAVAMTYHAPSRTMRCHYCSATRPAPSVCPGCGGVHLRLLGVGTQRVEEEVRRLFPEARTARVDQDTMSRKGVLTATLRDFARGDLDTLVGTQMIAKGLDIPGVGLVGVVAADVSLHLPDFRAGERTFQLLVQVAGRAGRGDQPGEVVVQTYTPTHPAVVAAAGHDYEGFYAQEISVRAQLRYPPFTHLINVVASHPQEDSARRAAEAAARALDEAGGEVLGPAPAPFSRLRGRHRWQVVLKADDVDTACPEVRRALASIGVPKGTRMAVDVDPIEMV